MSRTNFYCNTEHNRKGITDGVILNGQQFQHGWTTSAMPMEDTSKVAYGPLPEFPVKDNIGFFRAEFEIADAPADTFLSARPTTLTGRVNVCGFRCVV